jgi:hypothetical protein
LAVVYLGKCVYAYSHSFGLLNIRARAKLAIGW